MKGSYAGVGCTKQAVKVVVLSDSERTAWRAKLSAEDKVLQKLLVKQEMKQAQALLAKQ